MNYNGWTNYSTWAVNLWLANDEGLYDGVIDQLGGLRHSADTEARLAYRLAEWLKESVREALEYDEPASMKADLLGYALDLVNWREIAESWIEDYPDDDEPEAA